jgi:ketosteroid isomerase-like protein
MKKIAFLSLAAVIILAACQPKPAAVDLKAEAEAIRNIEDQWLAANKTKDISKVLSIFASDAVVMEKNMPIVVGIDAIQKSWEKWFADTTFIHNSLTGTTDNIEVSASGDLGYARGTNHYSIKTKDGIIEIDDKYVDIFKKTGGEWKCIVGIWNSDKP